MLKCNSNGHFYETINILTIDGKELIEGAKCEYIDVESPGDKIITIRYPVVKSINEEETVVIDGDTGIELTLRNDSIKDFMVKF